MKAKEIREKYKLNLAPKRIEEKITKEEWEAMQLYRVKLEGLYKAKRKGDMKLVGEMLGITSDYADKSFMRSSSRYHIDVVDALEEIIESREKLLQRRKGKNQEAK